MTSKTPLFQGFSALLIALFLTLISFSAQALVNEEDGVAKVIVLRGEVKVVDHDGNSHLVEKDMWLAEGMVLQSAEKSFCRLLFIDRSTMNLGPESQMKIDEFPKDKAGIITLMKGQVRSNVTKDYMSLDDKDKSKLFIKTKTAAMGVRGTDFQVNYNPRNENTALITFSGVVAMAQLQASQALGQLDQRRLEAAVSGDRAVQVRQGEFSGVTPTTSRATIPTKMSPVQLESLKNNETGIIETSDASSADVDRSKYRNPVPPGVNSKSFANDPRANAAKAVSDAVGPQVVVAQAQEPEPQESSDKPPAEGFFNAATGEYAPPAGSVIDLATVNIVPPPKGAAFDPISGTFNLPPDLGGVNPKTGAYEAPQGLRLADDGSFVAIQTPDAAGGRAPASIATAVPVLQNPTATTQQRSPASASGIGFPASPTAAVGIDIDNLVRETQLENERTIENNTEQTLIQTTTNATFRFSIGD